MEAADLPIYFAHPHSSWERPTLATTSGLIRDYIPNAEDVSSYRDYLGSIAVELNERRRAVLKFVTSPEIFERLLLTD